MIRWLLSFRSMRLPAVAAVVLLLGVAGGASAYFTSHGTGTASASVGTLNPPSNVTTQQTGADVTISWSAATLSSGGSVQGYRVKRSDNTTICGSPTLVTSLSCTDTSVPSGTYTYTVTAVYNSFTASAASSSITVLTVPSITAEPSNPSASSAPSFSFSGGGGSGYQCQLDSGGFSACVSPKSYGSLADGSHTFKVHAAQGSSTGPDTTYTWTIDTSAPSVTAKPSNPSASASPSFSFSHTRAVYTFKCQLDGGGFSACASPKSYSSLVDGSHIFQVEGVSADGATTSIASYTWLIDTTAPSGGSVSYTNGYLTSASVSVTLTQGADSGSGVNAGSGILQRSTSPLSNGSCTGFGSFLTIATNPSLSYTDSTVTDGHCYKYQYLVSDNVGNQATYTSTSVAKIDTTAPVSALSLGASPSHAFLNGSTLYFKSDIAGSFTLVNAVSDSGSGPASATFPLVSATNWTHAAQTVSTPAPGPYTSSTYSWTSGAGTPSGTEVTFTSADIAGNSSASAVLTLTPDTTAPSGGAVSVNGTAASSGGSTSTSTSTSFTIGSRTDYAETQSASQSGLASSVLTIQSETFSNNVCGAPGSGGAYTSPTTISGTTNPAIETGFCYLYTLTGTDNVGNAASVKTTVKVDTTAPSSPTVSLSTATGNTFISGTTAYINAQAGKSGAFKATGSSSDTQSGISVIALPSLTGFSKGGGTLSSPFETTYEWSGAVGASGAQSVTATNGVGLTATNSSAFTVTSDTTAPSGGALTVNGTAASGAGSTSTSTSTGFTIESRADYTDSGSGLASSVLTIQSETFSNNVCGAPGSGGAYTSPTTIGRTTNPAIETGFCYLYTLTGTDNVGNAISISTTVAVDTTAPSTPTLSFSGLSSNAFYASGNNTLFFRPAAGGTFTVAGSSNDNESGIKSGNAGYTFSSLTTNNFALTQTGGQGTYTFGESATPPGSAPTIFATNNAGLASGNATYNLVKDTTAPSGGSVSVSARTNTSVQVTFSAGTDSGSGVNTPSGQLTRASASYTASTDTCGTFGSFTNVGSTGTSSPFTDGTSATGNCYEYKYTVSDNVGNSVTYGPTTAVKFNSTGPALTGISSTNGNGILETGDVLTLTFNEPIAASSIPTSTTITMSRSGNNTARLSITGITTGSEGWDTGDSAYMTKNKTTVFNATTSVSGSSVKVTVGSNVSEPGTATAGSGKPVVGVLNSGITDLFGNTASSSSFLITVTLW
jgi:hypothetical protein